MRIGKARGVFEAFVAEPENVEARLIARDDLVIRERPPSPVGLFLGPGGLAFVAIGGIEAGYEFIVVGSREPVLLQCEMYIGSEIIEPDGLGPRGLAGRAPVCEAIPLTAIVSDRAI